MARTRSHPAVLTEQETRLAREASAALDRCGIGGTCGPAVVLVRMQMR